MHSDADIYVLTPSGADFVLMLFINTPSYRSCDSQFRYFPENLEPLTNVYYITSKLHPNSVFNDINLF